MEGSEVPSSQPGFDDQEDPVPEDLCNECESDPCICEEMEQDDVPRPLARSAAFSTSSGPAVKRPLAGKRPMGPPPPRRVEHFAPQEDAPDLFEYFSEFDLTPMEVVGVCRTFANYLCAQEKPRLKEKSKTSRRF